MRILSGLLRFFILIGINLFAAVSAYSQDSDSSKVTFIKGITIYGLKYHEFSRGSYQQNLDSALKVFPARSLSNLLQRNTSVYIRNYGNQMLSTISIRGTGSGHTATLWNGLNISSPTLGQFDFSQAPSIVTDALSLHYGGSSALFGNESIGGTIVMQSQSEWHNKPSIFIYQDVGSFGSLNSMATIRANSNHFESATKAYFSKIENDFPFINILLPGAPLEQQKNARSNQKGFVQDFYWRPESGKEASIHAWLHGSDRQLQPSMANPNSEDTQEDFNLRLQATWKQSGEAGYVNTSVGFLHDYMIYNQRITTGSNQAILQSEIGRNFSKKLAANIGGSLQQIKVETDNYAEDLQENRWDIYSWVRFSPSKIWSVTANLRFAGSTTFRSPLSPSLGSELILLTSRKGKLTWESVASLNYRIPTLNDRYWNPGGNPALRPENSLSLESGFEYSHQTSFISYEASLRFYSMSVDNWIIWLPDNAIWRPRNIRQVRNSGLELNVSGNLQLSKASLFWNTAYSYTTATNLTQIDQYDRSKDKQLPYVPYHQLAFSIGIKRSSWKTSITSNYTGDRFTSTDNQEKLESFVLMDFLVSKSFETILIDLSIENMFNTTYYHLPYRAMPGRNYRLGISLKI